MWSEEVFGYSERAVPEKQNRDRAILKGKSNENLDGRDQDPAASLNLLVKLGNG